MDIQALTKLVCSVMHWPMAFEYDGEPPLLCAERAFSDICEGDDSLLRPQDENGNFKVDQSDWTFVDTWKAMEKLPKEKVRAIGVSNFSLKT
jgi:diketogulonate reductase-like aldo/keto reductase